MHPRFSVDTPPTTWYNPGIYQRYQSSYCKSEKTPVIGYSFIRQRRQKISPMLPNPDYFPTITEKKYYQKIYQKIRPPLLISCPYGKKKIVPMPFKRRQQFGYGNNLQAAEISNQVTSSTTHIEVSSQGINFNSAKNNLLQSITKVDSEITKIQLEIAKRIKTQQEFEKASRKSSHINDEKVLQPAHNDLFQKIFAENRQKAHDAHNILANFCTKVDSPLYNQPFDTAIYHENKKKFIVFKDKLVVYLKRKFAERMKTQKALFRLYSSLACKWSNNVKKIENSCEYKTNRKENEICFEMIFPELQKKKCGRGRSKLTGDIKNKSDFQELNCKLQMKNFKEEVLTSSAAIPPLLLDAEQRSKIYINNNNIMKDSVADIKEKELMNLWTNGEKEIFKEKFIQYYKKFGIVANFLDKKNVCDCVKFYYRTKKSENYKQLLRKSRQRQRLCCNPLHICNE